MILKCKSVKFSKIIFLTCIKKNMFQLASISVQSTVK